MRRELLTWFSHGIGALLGGLLLLALLVVVIGLLGVYGPVWMSCGSC